MKLRTITSWRPRGGRSRTIRLYQAWHNMRGRLRGTCSREDCDYWRGLPCDFVDWPGFRAWALAAGYSAVNNSLDRIDPSLGYVRSNLQWVPIGVNSWRANHARWNEYRHKHPPEA